MARFCGTLRALPLEKWPLVCEVAQLSAGEVCASDAAYTITISYLGRPAFTLRLCKLHILDTWHLAQQGSGLIYGEPANVKAVAVKKI